MRIEDYAIVGDTQTVALVGRDGSIDWLCFPRFDSAACFSALLGTPEHGRWKIAPAHAPYVTRRRYRNATLILESEMATPDGTVRVIDFMPIRGAAPDLVRIVEGVSGTVKMRSEIDARFDFGAVVPWVRPQNGCWQLVAGPDALEIATPVRLSERDGALSADLVVRPGDRVPFVLTWYASYERAPSSPDPERALADTEEFWTAWAQRCAHDGPYREPILRSLLTLKALTYEPSGGIVAAGTTSLPEDLGGARNWDYRYCWVRDATFTLQALLHAGYREEARAWREWLVRAVAGEPAKLQILYGVTGERRIDERVIEWLPGFEGSTPVRIGNAAVGQRQLDVYGELMDLLFLARLSGLEAHDDAWAVQRATLDWLESHWDEPDEGIWEVRGPQRHFTFSKVMVWTAFDRAVKTVERLGLPGPVERWRALRQHIHAETCRYGFDAGRCSFTQAFGSPVLDASLLLIPIVGFLPPRDPRVLGTIDAIERELVNDGFVQRYPDFAQTRQPRRIARQRRCVSRVLVLVGRCTRARRSPGRRPSTVRAVAARAQRRRPALRRVRHGGEATRRQLSTGVLPRRADQQRTQPSRVARSRRATRIAGVEIMKGKATIVVITGGTAGVGRATARRFAASGAAVAVLARGRDGLEATQRELVHLGARSALAIACDVADSNAVFAAADQVERELGPIDIWINNAMTTVFGRFRTLTPDQFERVTSVTYLGFVWGTRAALDRMIPRNRGTIVQVGSALAYRSIPLQSAYCGAKHAIVGFTDSIRSELIHDDIAIDLACVHLPAVNTPQFAWCENHMPYEAQPVPPIFQPEIIANAIYHTAYHPKREVFIAWPTIKAVIGQKLVPGYADRVLAGRGFEGQYTDTPRDPNRRSNLFEPVPGDHGARGQFALRARERDLVAFVTGRIGAAAVVAAASIAAFGGALLLGRWLGKHSS